MEVSDIFATLPSRRELSKVSPSAPSVEGDENHGQNAVTQRNFTKSPLLRLPPELRYSIYSYLFGDTLILVNRVACDECLEEDSQKQFKSSPEQQQRLLLTTIGTAVTPINLYDNRRSPLAVRATWSTVLDLPTCDYCSNMWEYYQGLCSHGLKHLRDSLPHTSFGEPYPGLPSLCGHMNSVLLSHPVTGARDMLACPRHFGPIPSSESSHNTRTRDESAPWPFPASALRVCRQMAAECRPLVSRSYRTLIWHRGTPDSIIDMPLPLLSHPCPRPGLVRGLLPRYEKNIEPIPALSSIRTLHINYRQCLVPAYKQWRLSSSDRTFWYLPDPELLVTSLPSLSEVRLVWEEDWVAAQALLGLAGHNYQIIFDCLVRWAARRPFRVGFEARADQGLRMEDEEGSKIFPRELEVLDMLEEVVDGKIKEAQMLYAERAHKAPYWYPGGG